MEELIDEPNHGYMERDLATSSVSRRTSPTREVMNQICEEPITTQSSGGFQMFLRSLGDEEAFKISADVSKFHVVSCKNNENGTPEVLTLLAVLRHHYNSFDVAARRKYESEARLLVKDVNEHSQSETDEPEDTPLFHNDIDMEAENDESCCKYEEVGYISKTAPKMIISEFPYSSEKMIRLNRIHQGNLTDRMICAQCCLNPGDVPVITKIENPSHLLSHRSAHLYGCHFCRTVYPDANQLKKHQCLPFAEFLATKLLTREVEMLSSRIVLACSDCGAYVPWRPNSKNKVKNGWKKFMKTHNPEHILPIVVFFAVEDVENDMTIEIKYIPTYTRETVLSCSPCRIAMFSSPLDAEKHFADRSLHPDKDLHRCKHCQKTFALESFYKEHLLQCIFTEDSHQDGNPLLADWLTFCANILSPAGRVSGTKEIAVYGGSQVPPNCDKNKTVSKVESCAVARRHNAALRKAQGKMLASDIDEEKTKWDDHSKARSLLQKLAPESSSGLTMSLENFLSTDGEDLKGEDMENVSFPRPVEPPIISSMFCRFEKSVKIRLGEGCSYSEACGHEKIHLCQRCNHFVRDDSAFLSHLNQCAPLSDGLQHDIDDRTMSFPVGFGGIVINRLYCPECSESSCSIGALRTHLATIHGIWTGSLLNRDVARRPPRIQNVASLRTNLALGLDETGKLPLLKKSGDDVAPASIRHRLSQQTNAKKTIDTTSCWRESREEEDAEDSPLNDHTQGPINKVSDQVKNCSTMLRGTTQTPSHSDVPSVSGVVQSPSRSSSSSNSLVNTHPKKPYRASQSEIPCLICHGIFPSARALSNHHRKHLEMPLKRCFLCPSAESHAATFQTLEQLLHHLQTHVIETVTPTLDKLRLCWFCREKTTLFHLPGHLMYQCTKLPCCIWCGFEAATRQELQQHTNSVHFSNFTRLLCTHCPMIFHSLKLARDHRCAPNALEPAFFRCACNRPQIYISPVEYSEHFNLCHRVDGKCAFCFLSTSEDHNQSHAHQRALGKAEDGLRRIVVMDMEMMDEEIHYDKDDWIGLEELDCLHPPPDYHQGQGNSHQETATIVRKSTARVIRSTKAHQQNRQTAHHQSNSDALARQQLLPVEQEETLARNRAERISLDFSICGMKQLTVLAQMRCCVCGQFRIESELRIVPSMPEIREHWMRIVFDAVASSLSPSHLELFRKKLGLKFAALGTDCYICTRHLKRLDANRDIPCVISQDVFMDHATTCFFCDMKKDRAQLVSLTTSLNMRSAILDKLTQGSLNPDGTQRTKTELARRLLFSISEQICSAHFPGTSVNSNVAVGLPLLNGIDQHVYGVTTRIPAQGPSGVQVKSPGNVVNAQSNQHGYVQQQQQLDAHHNNPRPLLEAKMETDEELADNPLKVPTPPTVSFDMIKKEEYDIEEE